MSSEYEVELAEQETNGKGRRGTKEGGEMSGKNKKFFPAPDVEDLARELIDEYHSILREAKIRYIFRDGTWNKDGKPCPGEAKKMSPLVNALTEIDFGIVINYKFWETINTKTQRRAVLDHILTQCTCTEDKDGNPKWCIQKPPFSEFPSIVERHGSYTEDLKYMQDAFKNYEKSVKEMREEEKNQE